MSSFGVADNLDAGSACLECVRSSRVVWVMLAVLAVVASCSGSASTGRRLPVQRLCGQGVSVESFLVPVEAAGQVVTLRYGESRLIVFTGSCRWGPDVDVAPDGVVTAHGVIHGRDHGVIAAQIRARALHGGTALISACTTGCRRVLIVKVPPCLSAGQHPPRPPTPVACPAQ